MEYTAYALAFVAVIQGMAIRVLFKRVELLRQANNTNANHNKLPAMGMKALSMGLALKDQLESKDGDQ